VSTGFEEKEREYGGEGGKEDDEEDGQDDYKEL